MILLFGANCEYIALSSLDATSDLRYELIAYTFIFLVNYIGEKPKPCCPPAKWSAMINGAEGRIDNGKFLSWQVLIN